MTFKEKKDKIYNYLTDCMQDNPDFTAKELNSIADKFNLKRKEMLQILVLLHNEGKLFLTANANGDFECSLNIKILD